MGCLLSCFEDRYIEEEIYLHVRRNEIDSESENENENENESENESLKGSYPDFFNTCYRKRFYSPNYD